MERIFLDIIWVLLTSQVDYIVVLWSSFYLSKFDSYLAEQDEINIGKFDVHLSLQSALQKIYIYFENTLFNLKEMEWKEKK